MKFRERVGNLSIVNNKGFGLLTDTLILGLGNATQKIILLLLMPIYTSVLTTSEYGTIDILITFIELLVPIMTLNIESTVFRFAIDDDCDRSHLLNYSLGIIWISTAVAGSLFTLLHLAGLKFYFLMIIGIFVTSALRNVIANYVRGIGKVRVFAIGGIVATISLAISNIVVLIVIGAGINGYLFAIIISNLFHILALIILESSIWISLVKSFSFANLFSVLSFKSKRNKEYLNYSVPLIPNTLSWWINSASSRYILLYFWGASTTGLYSAAIKIPSIINLFSTVFQQAWQYYASKESRNKSKLIFYKKVYLFFGSSIIIICSVVIQFSKLISSLILQNEFFVAWTHVPFLVLSSAIATVTVFFGGIYTAEKRSVDLMMSTIVGSLTNIILSVSLTSVLGIRAVVFASIISNLIILIYRIRISSRQLKIRLNQKHIFISFFLLFFQSYIISLDVESSFLIGVTILLVIVVISVLNIIFLHKKNWL